MKLNAATKILFSIGVAAVMAGLMHLIDDGWGPSWAYNVLRNWQEFGIFSLHGQMISNPAGFGVPEHAEIYKGMSPVCLYPVYFVTQFFGWSGLGTDAFYILFGLATFWGIWHLLGQNNFALAIAAAAILCPGYMRYQRELDPNAISVLPVIPYAAVVLTVLRRPKLSPMLLTALFLLTLGFASLNWTTAWVCGPCILLLFGMPGINRRTLLLFIGILGTCVALTVVASLIAKSGGGQSGINLSNPLQVIRTYMSGSIGYGQGMTWGKAFVRLAFVNAVGLFPLWLVLIYISARRIRSGDGLSWIQFAPLILTILELGVMRNYFGHHPWMSCPVIFVGMIFSLALLQVAPAPDEKTKKTRIDVPFKFTVAATFPCILYGLAVLIFLRTNENNSLSLLGLVRAHTQRSDIIVVVKNSDPDTAKVAGRLDEILDRRVIVLDDFKDLVGEKNHSVILSALKLDDSFTLVAQSSAHSQQWLSEVANWFNHSVARRNPGDRLELADAYYLYELKP